MSRKRKATDILRDIDGKGTQGPKRLRNCSIETKEGRR